MISYVAKLINLFAVTVQKVLLVASFIGKVIVSVVTGISFAIISLIQSVVFFFQIIYEDNISIFTEDLPNAANDFMRTVFKQWTFLQNGISLVYSDVNYKLGTVIGTVKWILEAVIIVVSEVLYLVKNSIIFIGDTLWFILMFIPVHLPQLVRAVSKNLSDFIVTVVVDAYMALLKITNFLTDVPLESFVGITSAIVVVRLCIHFKEAIVSNVTVYYWFVVRKLWYYYYAFYNYFIDPEVREITRMSGQEVGTGQVSPSSAVIDDGTADALCVICQERQKCVLTLPCRHVCLCSECCMRLYGYQRTCPICRTFIYHSVNVYL